jgi:nucleotidyltransferase substrate binding protein (TIGR01987 family)
MQRKSLNELEEQGLIQAFEYTHELAWRTLSDFVKSRGNTEIFGSKDATREVFQLNLIENGEVWMEMIRSRNMTAGSYDKAITEKITHAITQQYYAAFLALEKRLDEISLMPNA